MIKKKIVDGKEVPGVFIETTTNEVEINSREVESQIAALEMQKMWVQDRIDILKKKQEAMNIL